MSTNSKELELYKEEELTQEERIRIALEQGEELRREIREKRANDPEQLARQKKRADDALKRLPTEFIEVINSKIDEDLDLFMTATELNLNFSDEKHPLLPIEEAMLANYDYAVKAILADTRFDLNARNNKKQTAFVLAELIAKSSGDDKYPNLLKAKQKANIEKIAAEFRNKNSQTKNETTQNSSELNKKIEKLEKQLDKVEVKTEEVKKKVEKAETTVEWVKQSYFEISEELGNLKQVLSPLIAKLKETDKLETKAKLLNNDKVVGTFYREVYNGIASALMASFILKTEKVAREKNTAKDRVAQGISVAQHIPIISALGLGLLAKAAEIALQAYTDWSEGEKNKHIGGFFLFADEREKLCQRVAVEQSEKCLDLLTDPEVFKESTAKKVGAKMADTAHLVVLATDPKDTYARTNLKQTMIDCISASKVLDKYVQKHNKVTKSTLQIGQKSLLQPIIVSLDMSKVSSQTNGKDKINSNNNSTKSTPTELSPTTSSKSSNKSSPTSSSKNSSTSSTPPKDEDTVLLSSKSSDVTYIQDFSNTIYVVPVVTPLYTQTKTVTKEQEQSVSRSRSFAVSSNKK